MPRYSARFTVIMLTAMLAMRASAQAATCLPAADLEAALARHYQERPLAQALTDRGVLLTVYVAAGGSWTITATQAGGPSCIVAAGQDFNLLHRDGRVPAVPTGAGSEFSRSPDLSFHTSATN